MKSEKNYQELEKTIQEMEEKIKFLSDTVFQLKTILDNFPSDVYWKDKKVWLGLAHGMNDVISKPATIPILKATIARFMLGDAGGIVESEAPLGFDLPDTEEELFNLDMYPIFDIQFGLSQINDMPLFTTLIKEYVSDVIQNDINKMTEAYCSKNWESIEKLAHKIKGGAAYIGIQRMLFACQFLERYHKAGHSALLEPLYHQVIEVNSKTVKELNKWIDQYFPNDSAG